MPIPTSHAEAIESLMFLVHAQAEQVLRAVDHDLFVAGWAALAFLYPGLHPDELPAPGRRMRLSFQSPNEAPVVAAIEPRLIAPLDAESGWPLILLPIGSEAWRRLREGLLTDDELYPSDAQHAGIQFRQSDKCDPL